MTLDTATMVIEEFQETEDSTPMIHEALSLVVREASRVPTLLAENRRLVEANEELGRELKGVKDLNVMISNQWTNMREDSI